MDILEVIDNTIHNTSCVTVSQAHNLLQLMDTENFLVLRKLIHLQVDSIILDSYASDILDDENIKRLKIYNEVKSTFDDMLTLIKTELEHIANPKDEEDVEDV